MAERSYDRMISVIGRTLGSGSSKGFAFEPVAFAAREWADKDYGVRYHVFRSADPDDRITLPAKSAVEAIRASGVDRPYRILRGQSNKEQRIGVVKRGRLVKTEPPPPEPVQ